MGTNTPPTTPERAQTAKAQSDTPISHNKTPSVHGSEIHIDASREAVVKDAGPSIPQVPFQFFEDNVLPKLPSGVDVANTIAALRRSGVITPEKRWKEFPKDPVEERPRSAATKAQRDQAEDKTFRRLIQVVKDIIAASEFDEEELKLEYLSMPNHVPICDYVSKTSKPDAYLVFRRPEPEPEPIQKKKKKKSTASRIAWREICCPAEYKLDDADDDVLDNVTKICWNMYQVMHEDPRRRFVYAFTIENTTMRVWFANRSEMIVSDPFNFITEHEKVARFFLSLMCAGQDHELGLDPTMQLRPLKKNEKPSYDMAVRKATGEEVFYRTRRLVDQSNAAALRGRGTRVWSVVRLTGKDGVEDEEHTGVLKDAWVDADRSREGDILEQVRSVGGKVITGADQPYFEKSFLDVLVHGDVYCNGMMDNTCILHMRNVKPPRDALFSLQIPQNRPTISTNQVSTATPSQAESMGAGPSQGSSGVVASSRDDSVTAAAADPGLAAPTSIQPDAEIETPAQGPKLHHGARMDYPAKTRYRIVFKQECTPLHKITSLSRAFRHLGNVVMAVQYLHMTGWLHRDISTGNVLIDENVVNSVRLADLEYAKEMGDLSSHDVRTGTANFMAVEVDTGKYVYKEAQRRRTRALPTESLATLRERQESGKLPAYVAIQPVRLPQLRPPQGFRHNSVHDMESTWWMSLDFLINRERYMQRAATPLNSVDKSLASDNAAEVTDSVLDGPSTVPTSTDITSNEPMPSDSPDHIPIASETLTGTSVVADSPDINVALTEEDREYARSVFYGRSARIMIIAGGGGDLEDALNRLPPPIHFIGEELLVLRTELVEHYKFLEAEGNPVPRAACTEELYRLFTTTFWNIASALENIEEIKLAPLKPSAGQIALYNNNYRKVCGAPEKDHNSKSAKSSGLVQSGRSGGKRRSAHDVPIGGSKKQKVDE